MADTDTNNTAINPLAAVGTDSTPASTDTATNISQRSITQEMRTAYINYAMSVIVARALPDVRDGLKPVQRRIIYSMFKQNIVPSGGYKKSARTVGDVIAKYHPHGDVAVYDAMVRMAQEFSMRYPLVDGQGNFGSIDGDNAAAMRYTESRLQKLSMEIIEGLNKKTVDYAPNYDGNTREPILMPTKIPGLLLNGAEGIAVGMATKIPPHNLTELVGTIQYTLQNGKPVYKILESTAAAETINAAAGETIEVAEGSDKDAVATSVSTQLTAQTDYTANIRTEEDLENLPKNRFPTFESTVEIKDLLKIMPGPDFPTSAEIYDTAAIAEAYTTGKGRILMRAVAKIEEMKGGRFHIVITEIPYQVNKARLVSKIADLVKEKKIEGVSDIRDESNRVGMRIVVEIKRDGQPKTILNRLFKYTEMEKTFNANMLALVGNDPQIINLKTYVELFIGHRQEVIIREKEFELAKSREREHILEGLMIALDNLDEVIRIIRESSDSEAAKLTLMSKFKLSEIQSTAILDMQLRRLAALERKKIEEEYKEIRAKIDDLIAIITKPERVLAIISEQLTEIVARFGDKRRTKVHKGKVGEVSEEDLIASEDVVVTISEKGYIKRIKADTYQTQLRGGVGIKGMTTREDDAVKHLIAANTHDEILFFTSKGRVFLQKVYDIPEFSRTAKGQAVINLINIEPSETITSILTKKRNGFIVDKDIQDEKAEDQEKKASTYKFLFMATANGTVKKTTLEEFLNIRSNGLIAIKLDATDNLTWVKPTHGNDDIILVTKFGKAIRFNESDVRETGRSTMGVRGIRLRDNTDTVIAADVIRSEKSLLLTMSEKGFGKTSVISEFTKQGRGGMGLFAARCNDKTGPLVASRLLDGPEIELLMMSEQGQTVKIKGEELPQRNRQTSGVRLIRLKGDDKVGAIALV